MAARIGPSDLPQTDEEWRVVTEKINTDPAERKRCNALAEIKAMDMLALLREQETRNAFPPSPEGA